MSRRGKYAVGAATLVVLMVELVVAVVLLGIWWLFLRDVTAFRFGRPEMLQAQVLGPVLALIFLLHLAWRSRALRRFTSSNVVDHLVPGLSTTRMVLRFLTFRHGLGLVLIALADPQFGTRLEEVRSEGVDVMVAVDVSNSMLAEDLRPSRMELARRALSRLIDRLQGDRLGLVVFAGEAYVQLPITTDRSAARLFLASVNTGSVPTQGTAIGAAIDLAHRSFDMERPGSRAIIVITDGENHEDDAEGAAREAARNGIVVHTIGMGTPQGAPIPIRRGGQITGFRKDNRGNTVVSRLDEDMLLRIATAGGGTYTRATERDPGIEGLLEELRSLETTETGTWQYAAHESQFQYPLGIGLLLILIGMGINERGVVRHKLNWT
jgi:Ca-activated chloride channel homolog